VFRLPPLLWTRPAAIQLLLTDVVPLGYGAVCGVVLGASKDVYLVLQLFAIIGGFLAGLEHEKPAEGAARGEVGGLLFGIGILLAHGLTDTKAKAALPDPEILLVVITMAGGVILGALGARWRAGRTAKA
jgi:hypothetical protein